MNGMRASQGGTFYGGKELQCKARMCNDLTVIARAGLSKAISFTSLLYTSITTHDGAVFLWFFLAVPIGFSKQALRNVGKFWVRRDKAAHASWCVLLYLAIWETRWASSS